MPTEINDSLNTFYKTDLNFFVVYITTLSAQINCLKRSDDFPFEAEAAPNNIQEVSPYLVENRTLQASNTAFVWRHLGNRPEATVSRCQDLDFKQETSEYEVGMLTTCPRYSI